MIKMLSVSRVLNLYFDEIDLMAIPVQQGIFRGVVLDKTIENYFTSNKLVPISCDDGSKSIMNKEVLKQLPDLYKQALNCVEGFKIFEAANDFAFLTAQLYVKNAKLDMHGYIDATIKFNGQKYIVDWKSKGKFSAYDYEEINKVNYDKYVEWCQNNHFNYKTYSDWQVREKTNKDQYSLGHLRYCLQVCFYWLLLDKPKEYKGMVAYFDANQKYYLYTFDLDKCQVICQTMLEYANGSKRQQKEINAKLKKFKWKKIINWKLINK